jgi:hypothetical protein
LAYNVLVGRAVAQQLRDAPGQLQGYVAGIVAFLRVDPTAASVAFTVVSGPGYRTIIFANGRGFLDYEVVEEDKVVLLTALTWL